MRSGFDGHPLATAAELGPYSDAYVESTLYVTKDGRRAVECRNGRFYLAACNGKRLDHPISEDQLA
ncbi:MAG: hypothetical protein OXK79_13200 [Chloroflexota bacterium]|nr:hypothetical protein [Chloroflexota bacterium]